MRSLSGVNTSSSTELETHLISLISVCDFRDSNIPIAFVAGKVTANVAVSELSALSNVDIDPLASRHCHTGRSSRRSHMQIIPSFDVDSKISLLGCAEILVILDSWHLNTRENRFCTRSHTRTEWSSTMAGEAVATANEPFLS